MARQSPLSLTTCPEPYASPNVPFMTWQQFHFPPRRSRRGYWVAASNAGRVRLSKALVEKMGSAQRYAIGIDKSGNAIAFAPNAKAGLKFQTSSLALRREFQEPPPAAATFSREENGTFICVQK